jgi:hypothetical protein
MRASGIQQNNLSAAKLHFRASRASEGNPLQNMFSNFASLPQLLKSEGGVVKYDGITVMKAMQTSLSQCVLIVDCMTVAGISVSRDVFWAREEPHVGKS